MKIYKIANISESNQIAIHLTTEKAKKEILESGSFIPSISGWRGAGLYAHLYNTGIEGKGNSKVGFSYANLKLNNGGKPEQLNQKQWDKLKLKDNNVIDKILSDLGYDGEMYENVIRIFPSSVKKLTPIDL